MNQDTIERKETDVPDLQSVDGFFYGKALADTGIIKVQSVDAFLYMKTDVTGRPAVIAYQPYSTLALSLSATFPFGPEPDLAILHVLAAREMLAAGASRTVPFLGRSVTLGESLSDATLQALDALARGAHGDVTPEAIYEEAEAVILWDPLFREGPPKRFVSERG